MTTTDYAPVIIKEKLVALQRGELSAVENTEYFLKRIKQSKLNAFLDVADDALAQAKRVDGQQKKGLLAGLVVGVKANINAKGLIASCASKTLDNYKAPYDADVITRIRAQGGIIIGMTNCDEFACGATGEQSAFGVAINPSAPDRIPGGSSSGSAVSVAAGLCDLSLGSETGGSIRVPASCCGIVGVKPSYGRVSRYGLIDLSMSLDQVGPLAGDVYGTALLLQVIAGRSAADATTFTVPVDQYSDLLEKKPALTLGVSDDLYKLCGNKEILALVQRRVEQVAKKYTLKIKNVSLPNINTAVQTYYPLVYTEFFSATRKFDGRRFGRKIEDSCGEEVLRRILGGKIISEAEFKGKYYRQALQVKRVIEQEIRAAFKGVDVLVSPVVPRLPHRLKEKISFEENYAYDALTTPANLSGICAGSVPGGKVEGVPIGVQIAAPSMKETILLQAMRLFEEVSA